MVKSREVNPLTFEQKQKFMYKSDYEDMIFSFIVISQIKKGFSCSDTSQEVDYKSKSGTCSVCSAPCSSCYHDNQILMKSAVESAGEICAEHTVANWCKRREMSIIETMNSSADSSEIAIRKAFLRTPDASASDDSVVLSKFEAQKVPEGYDDCLSCDTRIGDATKMLNVTSENVLRMDPRCSYVSTGCPTVQGSELTTNSQTLSQHEIKKFGVNHSRINYSRRGKIRGEFSVKLPSSDLPVGSSSRHLGLSEIPASKSTDDLLMVRDTSSVNSLLCGSNSRGIDVDKSSIPQIESLESSKEQLNSSLVGPVLTDVSRDLPATAHMSSENNDDMKAEIHTMDEAEDSDMVEQDVKVCDICGDAGREDLLAICCRCSDGAEHTYCMREMLTKVPEGDWMCEECQSSEKVRYRRRDKLGKVDENEKNNSGQASSEHMNNSDVEGNRTRSCMNIPTKRLRDDADTEVSSVVKKPAADSTVGTPKLSKAEKAPALSHENPSKNLDKGKVQSSHGNPTSDAVTVNNTPELVRPDSDLRSLSFQGTFSKSNSFAFLNSKPKVKLVDRVLQREKSASEIASVHLKNGNTRPIGRSISFKSTNSIYSGSKTKMLSPRLSNIKDIKNTKLRSSFERQSSLRSEDRPMNSMMATSMSSASRSDKKIASRAEPCSLSVSINHHETKPVQLGKPVALSRSSSIASRRSADLAGSVGDFKKPPTFGLNTPRVSSANDIYNFDEKSNHTSPNEDSSSCSGVFESPHFNAIECRPDGSARPGELTNSGEPSREDSGSDFRMSYVKSSRKESNNLRAAIEAAVLRKPIGFKKHRYDDTSASSKGCDFSSKDHLSSSTGRRIGTSSAVAAEMHTVSQTLTADSHGTLNTVDNLSSVAEVLSSGGDELPSIPVDVKASSRDIYSSVAGPGHFILKSCPEHEYIWQGSFEIYQGGKVFSIWDGIQAHMSTSASFKVIEFVDKFKSRIVLNEVPRISTWPVQFQENGVGEDNIALFFFAKDLESYAKSYKVWLENMMKNDLALKGSLDGVELLIFPSNQLPESSQRWNMLFFLWGVFRAKEESCLRNIPGTLKQFSDPQNIPPSIISVPGNRCRPVSKDLIASGDISSEPKVHASENLCDAMSTKAVNGDCDLKVSSLDFLDGRQNSSFSIAVRALEKVSIDVRQREQESHPSYNPSKCSLDMPSEGGIGETPTVLDRRICSQDQVKLRLVGEDLSTCVKVPVEEDRDTRGLNTDINRFLLNHNEYLHPKPTSMETRAPYACNSQVLPENDDKHGLPLRALEKMNHVVLENRDYVVCDEPVIPRHSENAERRFFPMELHPVRGIQLFGRSMPRKPNPLELNQHHDRAPNLELALGAERKFLTSDIQPSIIRNVERKVVKEYIHDARPIKADEDDDEESASLSLSLSFPFPREGQTSKPAQKTEQLVSQKDHVTTSLLLFHDFGDK
ncbi:protein PARALOG OF AIPP2-like isoform X2 [Henckelia pumila]|uniref:protein PARALOG OF AIPP2-like isoform X2 n=1 Tax=Henckelia pumila TaxID=405737 RepID=UPI003C6E3C64